MIKSLTNRQKEFLAKSAQGMTYQEIAENSYVTVRTVTSALESARKRLEVNNTLQCLAKAISREEIGLDHEGVCSVPKLDD